MQGQRRGALLSMTLSLILALVSAVVAFRGLTSEQPLGSAPVVPWIFMVASGVLAFVGGVLFTSSRLGRAFGSAFGVEDRAAERLDQRRVVGEMSKAVAGIVDSENLTSILIERLPELLGLDGGALFLVDPSGGLCLAGASGPIGDVVQLESLSREGAVASELLHASRPLTATELAARLTESNLSAGETRLLELEAAQLWVPLVRTGASRGYLLARLEGILLLGGLSDGSVLSIADRPLVGAVAWQAAVAAENIELVNTLRERAHQIDQLYAELVETRERESKRLARELHDEVIQDLVDLLYLVEPATVEPQAASRFGENLRATISKLRRVCSELRPSALDDLSFFLAVEGFVGDLRHQYGLPISLRLTEGERDDLERLPEETRLCLFRVLQEALANVRRHAQASSVDIELQLTSSHVALSVRDDGVGFRGPLEPHRLVRQGCFGLAGAVERVQHAGGELSFEPTSGSGTALRAVLPRTLEKKRWPNPQRPASPVSTQP